MNPYLGTIRDNVRSGKHLHLIDDDMLANIGITALGPRKTILQAVQLLLYFVSGNLTALLTSFYVLLRIPTKLTFSVH